MERINSPAWHEHVCTHHDITSGPCDCSHPEVDRACLECHEEWENQEIRENTLEYIGGEQLIEDNAYGLIQIYGHTKQGGKDMDINTAFPSKFLKAADLKGRRVQVVIAEVSMQDVGDKTEGDKPVVYFEGKEKGLVLNRTNSTSIAELSNDSFETDDWVGTTIVLFSTKVDYQGRRVDAIRVDMPANTPTSRPRQPKSVKEVIDGADSADAADEIPF